MEQQDVERIARRTLKDLGVTASALNVSPVAGQPGSFRIDFGGAKAIKVTCGRGSTPQWIRDQILEQYHSG